MSAGRKTGNRLRPELELGSFRRFGSKVPLQLEKVVMTRFNSILKLSFLRLSLNFLPALAIFAMAYDQGQIESLIGLGVPGANFLHEFFHDLRHVAGYMCH